MKAYKLIDVAKGVKGFIQRKGCDTSKLADLLETCERIKAHARSGNVCRANKLACSVREILTTRRMATAREIEHLGL